MEAGADLLFADALMSETDIGTFVEQVQAPVLVNMGFGIRRRATTPLLPGAQLQRLGVAAVIYPRLLTSAAIAGMRSAMKALDESIQSGQATDRPDLCVSFDELNELMGLSEIAELEVLASSPTKSERASTEREMARLRRRECALNKEPLVLIDVFPELALIGDPELRRQVEAVWQEIWLLRLRGSPSTKSRVPLSFRTRTFVTTGLCW